MTPSSDRKWVLEFAFFFSILEIDERLIGLDKANKADYQSIQNHLVNGSQGNGRLVNRDIVLVEQHTFNEFSSVLEVNIFSKLPKK